MGGIFSNCIKDAVNGALEDPNGVFKTELGNMKADLGNVKANIAELKNEVLAPKADKMGRNTVVAIHCSGMPTAVGHGVLLQSELGTFFVSAAHVVAMLATEPVDLKWAMPVGRNNAQTDIILNLMAADRSLYLPDEYIWSGKSDIGMFLINNRRLELGFTAGLVCGDGQTGEVVVGHTTNLFIRGIVARNNGGRLLVTSPSEGGCSGCPLFDKHGRLMAFVHGETKHRIGLQRDAIGPSSFVYCDDMSGIEFKFVPDCYHNILQKTENASIELIENGDHFYNTEGSNLLVDFIWSFGREFQNREIDIPAELSFSGLMKLLADNISSYRQEHVLDQSISHASFRRIYGQEQFAP